MEPERINILIPTHVPKSNWLIAFLESLNRVNKASIVRVTLLISDAADAAYFARLSSIYSKNGVSVSMLSVADCLVATPALRGLIGHYASGAAGAIAVFKKMVGFYHFCHSTDDDIVCIDADTIVISMDNSFFNKLEDNYNKMITAGHAIDKVDTNPFYLINTASAQILGQKHYDQIHSDGVDGIYNWFFDVPFYKNDDLRRFFSHMERQHGTIGAFFSALKWHTFEYIMYQYFLFVEKRLSIFDTSLLGIERIPEACDRNDLFRIRQAYNYAPLWIGAKNYFTSDFPCLDGHTGDSNIHLLYHFDRF
jgi:hypothetical protein